jgi:hypothetical protein
MTRPTKLIGVLAAVALSLLAGRPAAADVVVVKPFAATSGDECQLGTTKGTLGWHLTEQRRVDVRGTVVDRTFGPGPGLPCGDDGRFTEAIFTAYGKTLIVAPPVVQRVDNGQRPFTFSIASTREIDLVVVQICRRAKVPGPPAYCGPPVRHPGPVTP